MASLNNPVNIKKLLTAQQDSINANVDAKAVAVNANTDIKTTENKSHTTVKNTDNKSVLSSLVESKGDETQAVINGAVGAAVDSINSNTSVAIDSMISPFEASEVLPMQLIAAGATGVILSVTPPLGKRVRLTGLASSYTYHSNLTTVKFGGVVKINSVSLGKYSVSTSNALFKVGFLGSTCASVTGGVDEVMEISTDVATSQGTYCSYEFGE